ncbi:hypothetical protein D3C76_957750 [compost metagenome]
MIGHHVPQGAGVFVETATGFDADGFGGGDLHVVDVMVVPERFEQAVGEPADQDVLHGLLAQIVIDAIDLLFRHDLEQAGVQGLGGLQVGTEGFFDHHPAKRLGAFFEQAGRAETAHHFTEKAWRGGQVEHRVTCAAVGDFRRQRLISAVVQEVALDVADAFGEFGPHVRVKGLIALADFGGHLAADEVFEFFCEAFIADGVVVNADDPQAIPE